MKKTDLFQSISLDVCLYVMRSFFFSFRPYRDGKIGIFRSLSLEKWALDKLFNAIALP